MTAQGLRVNVYLQAEQQSGTDIKTTQQQPGKLITHKHLTKKI